jgi:hypothetical protein
LSIKQIIELIEMASGRQSTSARKTFAPSLWLEEFVSGITTDTNMSNMLSYFNANVQSPVTGNSFWTTSGLKPAQGVT